MKGLKKDKRYKYLLNEKLEQVKEGVKKSLKRVKDDLDMLGNGYIVNRPFNGC